MFYGGLSSDNLNMHEEDAKDGEGSGMDHVDKALSGQDPRTRLF